MKYNLSEIMKREDDSSNVEISEEAQDIIDRYPDKEVVFFDTVGDYVESYDISSFRLSDGEEEFEIGTFQLADGSSVYCEYDTYAQIEKDGKTYIWISSGEDELSFIEESQIYKELYVVYRGYNKDDCGYYNYMPIHRYPILSEKEAQELISGDGYTIYKECKRKKT